MSGVSKVVLVLAILAVVAGCSSVVSTWVNPKSNPNDTGHWADTGKTSHWVDNPHYQSGAGIAYFLPMGKVHITANRVDTLVTNYGMVYTKFQDGSGDSIYLTNLVSMTKVISNVVTEVYTTNKFLAAKNYFSPPSTLVYSNSVFGSNTAVGPAGTNGMKFTATPVGTNTPAQAFALTNDLVATSASASQTITLSNQMAQPIESGFITSNTTTTTIYTEQPLVTTNHTYNIVVSVDYMADPSKLFLLQPQRDWFHDDSANITVDGRGLLSSINASNTDQSGNVVVALAQAGVQSFELAGGMPIPNPIPSSPTPNAMFAPEDFPNPDALIESMNTNSDLIEKLPDSKKSNLKKWGVELKSPQLEDLQGKNARRKAHAQALAEIFNEIINTNTLPRPTNHDLALFFQDSTKIGNDNYRNQLLNRLFLEEVFPGLIAPLQPATASIPPNYPQQIDLSFNPFYSTDLNDASNELHNAGLTIVNSDVFSPNKQVNYRKWLKTPKKETDGIFYRPPIPYTFRIRDSVSNVVSATVLLPNLAPILHLEMDKAPFVSAISQVTLTNGFIGSYSFSKPSSAMALASYPLVLLSDITSSMTNLIQFRINLGTGQNNLQSTANSGQSIQNSALLAQQAALIAQLSNSITLYNLTQTLKGLTNSSAKTANP